MASTISRRASGDELATYQEVKRLFSERMTKRLGEWLSRREVTSEEAGSDAEAQESAGAWPMRFGLGLLTEARAMKDVNAVMQWVQGWHQAALDLPDGVQILWEPRQWRLLGQQQIPTAVVVRDTSALADWVGQGRPWREACARRDAFDKRFPLLRSAPTWTRYEEVATTWLTEDVSRLIDLLQWFEANPRSDLYPRQLPVPGIDTKWLDSRRGLVRDFVLASRGLAAGGDFFEVCGLRPAPATLRMRILCPEMRQLAGGLSDIEAPIEDLAQLKLRPRTVLVVENLATGLALPSLPGTVAFMKLGHAIADLAHIRWLFGTETGDGRPERVIYWGDLDTHGFVILARARGLFPGLRSILMDEQTLIDGKDQWVREASQSKVEHLERLTGEELKLYRELKAQTHGSNVRLEQERLAWPRCLQALRDAMA